MKKVLTNILFQIFISMICIPSSSAQTDGLFDESAGELEAKYYPLVLNELEKPGYQLIPKLSNEFGLARIGWSNWGQEARAHGPTGQEILYYRNNDNNFFFSFSNDANSDVLSVLCKEEAFLSATPNGWTDPNFDKKYYYSSGQAISGNGNETTVQYGFFEIRCRVPKGEGFWPAFWLYGSGYEIDVFEILSTNNGAKEFGATYHKNDVSNSGLNIRILGSDFTDDFHTFSVEWNEKYIKWYLNNKLVRYVDNNSDSMIDLEDLGEMRVIFNLAIDWWDGPDNGTPFPGKYEIDYIRSYKSISQSFCTFKINDKEDVIIFANEGEPLVLDATGSYSDDNTYFLAIHELGVDNEIHSTIFQRWLNKDEVPEIHDFNLNDIYSFQRGKKYKIDLLAGGGDWVFTTRNISIRNECQINSTFRINGEIQNVAVLPKSEIILDLASTESCDDTYYLKIEKLKQDLSSDGIYCEGWMNNLELKDKNYFDLRAFCDSKKFQLDSGTSYNVKWVSGGGEWKESNVIMKIEACEVKSNIVINDSDLYRIELNPLSPIIVKCQDCFSCDDTYNILVQKVDSHGDVPLIFIDANYSKWFSSSEVDLTNFELRSLFQGDFIFEENSYYRVRFVSGGGEWIEDNHIVHIDFCTGIISNASVNNIEDDQIIQINQFYKGNPTVVINATGSKSCDNTFYLSIQKLDANLIRTENKYERWYNYSELNYGQNYVVKDRIFRNLSEEYTFIRGNYYVIQWVSGGGEWSGVNKIIYIN